jgi:hypothetical protein
MRQEVLEAGDYPVMAGELTPDQLKNVLRVRLRGATSSARRVLSELNKTAGSLGDMTRAWKLG